MQRKSGEKLGEALIKLRILTPEQIAEALSEHLGIPRVDFSRRYIASEAVRLVPEEMIRSHEAIPLEVEGNSLIVAMADPLNIMAIDDLQRVTGYNIQPMIATAEEIDDAYKRTTDIASTAQKVFDQYAEEQPQEQPDDQEHLGDAPGVKLANMVLQQAITERASDIHLEPQDQNMRVRFRVDGIMREVMTIPQSLVADVSSRIKIMANLDITRRRTPQDGRIQLTVKNKQVDMRVSTLPTVYGEKIVARVFSKSERLLDIEDFGFSDKSVTGIYNMLKQSQGLILVTGPTGSGKTTTLYGFLGYLNSPERNVITIEDPVELRLDGVNQVQTNDESGLTFTAGLRTVLRQDPDVIMVGEIRDKATAEIAVRSALTGHLVLSTLHTNSASATITRLLDMGIEPYLISSTLNGIVAQRLVRVICDQCKEPVELADPALVKFIRSLNMPVPDYVYQGKGCPVCKHSGYRGRVAVEEVLVMNKEIRTAIENGAREGALEEIGMKYGLVPLRRNAVEKLISGITTASEVIRTVYSVNDEGDVQ